MAMVDGVCAEPADPDFMVYCLRSESTKVFSSTMTS